MANHLSCRLQYIWFEYSILKLMDLLFAIIVKLLRTQWVYKRALLLAVGDTNLFVDNWLQISSYPHNVSPIATVSHYKHITFVM